MTSPPRAAATSAGRAGGSDATLAVIAQVGVLGVTFVIGGLGVFTAQNAWYTALAQGAAGLALVIWFAARRARLVLVVVVPIVSTALTAGLAAASATVTVACSGILPAFEKVPPPPGVAVEPFVSPGVGCMAETPVRNRVESDDASRDVLADVFDHYRHEFPQHGWSIVPDGDEEELRVERDGMYVVMYGSENRVYFSLGRCGEWGTRCG